MTGGASSCGTRASGRLAHTLQKILQDDRIVVLFIPRGKKKGQFFSTAGKIIKFIEGVPGLQLY